MLTVGLCSLPAGFIRDPAQPITPMISKSLSELLFPGREAFSLWVWHACFVSRCFTLSFIILIFVSHPLYSSALSPQLLPFSVLQVTWILGSVSVFIPLFHHWKLCRFNVFMNLLEPHLSNYDILFIKPVFVICNLVFSVDSFFPPIFLLY